MSKEHIRQMLRHVENISFDVLQHHTNVVLLNDEIKKRVRIQEDDCVLPDPTVFHREENRFKVGVITKEKWCASLFEYHDMKTTVIVYWRTWMWYGTFRQVHKTLAAFFKEFKDQDVDAPLSCAVCLDSDQNMRKEYGFRCNHLFCLECLSKLAQAQNTCPLCRSPLL